MNYYKRHIGDYIKATAHLSLLEHGIYTRLLDVYYTRESPIPEDQAARLIGAKSKEEKIALRSVLEEFFVPNEHHAWRQERCDEEILDAAEFGEEREAKAENVKERQRRHRVERRSLFEQLRSHGIVPPWDTKTQALREHLSRVTGPLQVVTVTPPETQSVTPGTRTATAIQTPLAKTPEESESDSDANASGDFADSVDRALFADARKVFGKSIGGQVNKAIKSKGKPWFLGILDSCRSKDPEAARAYFAAALNGAASPAEASQRRCVP